MKPGRKKGTLAKTGMTAFLASMKVGERRYVETTLAGYAAKQRHLNMPHTRRHESIKDFVYTTNLFTAVSNSKAGDVRYIICLERVK